MFGELGLREYFETLPPAEQSELMNAVNGLLRCNALGIDRPLDHMPSRAMADRAMMLQGGAAKERLENSSHFLRGSYGHLTLIGGPTVVPN